MDEQNLQEFLEKEKIEPQLKNIFLKFAFHSLRMQDNFPKYLKGVENNPNKYGEIVAKLDKWANDSLVEHLSKVNEINTIYSEELEKPYVVNTEGKYYVTLDPLDGSSNIVANNVFGIILGVYDKKLPQKGENLKLAAIKVYGPVNLLIYSCGKGTHEFVKHYDEYDRAEFFLLNENLKFPQPGEVFGIGGQPTEWDEKFLKFAKGLFKVEKLKVRYCGSLVGDFSQILHRGGFFAYPSTKKSPQGKLRLTYECNPVAFIAENASGSAVDGKEPILKKEVSEIDQRTPFYVGNKEIIQKMLETLG
ncbi:MAG: class 1 fructose-bisphosphatase [Candidatus Anstonellaceae archaeon]